ncbi:MAG TPA: hypothetical protein DCW47_06505 [Lachnospiraceae bacterium]|nr:hypothetical protein [Lachnospiraceae bacterium]
MANKKQNNASENSAELEQMQKKLDELNGRMDQLLKSPLLQNQEMKEFMKEEVKSAKKKEKRRSAEIFAVFAAHNFYADGFTPEELRTTLEDLGPTYVKIGQIMSSRVDLLPESYCKELEKLRQNVKELDPALARAVIEQETGRKIEDIYSEFRDEPIGSASIGQAHYGVLKDGTKVVTKVQRPFIAELMAKDFILLKNLAKGLNVISEGNENKDDMVDLLSVIEELEKVTNEELDFRVEAQNTRFFKENCIDDEEVISCPTVIEELTSERLFTMTFVDGCSISKKEKLEAEGCDLMEIGHAIIDNYAHQVLDIGTFHADPHQGNIMVSNKKPYWIDFGMIGHLTQGDISVIQQFILSLLEMDVDSFVNALTSLGAASAKTNRNKLVEDLDVFMSKYMNVTSIADLNMTVLFDEIVTLADRHHISLPGRFTMLVRSIATIEGVIEELCPELNLFEIISKKLMDRAKETFDLGQTLLTAGKDALELGKKAARIPVLAFDTLSNLVKGRMKINLELTGYDELLKRTENIVRYIIYAMFSCVLFFGSCILATADIQPKTEGGTPLIAVVGILFSIVLGIYTVKRMLQK